MSAKSAKKTKSKVRAPGKAAAEGAAQPELKPEELAKAFRESYSPLPPVSSNTVVLDPDIAPHFQSSRAVNDALRALLRIVKQVRE